jgi:hypothetical protein
MNLLWIKVATSFILISGYDSFFVTMSKPNKRKAVSFQEKQEFYEELIAHFSFIVIEATSRKKT